MQTCTAVQWVCLEPTSCVCVLCGLRLLVFVLGSLPLPMLLGVSLVPLCNTVLQYSAARGRNNTLTGMSDQLPRCLGGLAAQVVPTVSRSKW
jgi:hypothetical protein